MQCYLRGNGEKLVPPADAFVFAASHIQLLHIKYKVTL